MQLKFTPPLAVKTTSSTFKPSISAVLSGMTAVGTCSAIAFNLDKANQFGNALSPLKNTFVVSFFSKGILNLSDTLKSWGESIFNSKDTFIDWLNRYFDVNGLKAGTVVLYNKLHDWALIVYEWFATKFLKFIENIPWIVQNWKQIRLSLFKWGTFIGGGGGSALWAMFGSGDNWDKLGELMGRDDFEEIMGDLGKLMENNNEAFEDMSKEEMQEIFEKFLHETDEAKQETKELLKQQEEKQKGKTEEEKEQLSKEEVQDGFKPPKGGKPENVAAVFGNMVSGGLNDLVSLFNSTSFDSSSSYTAMKAMQKYIGDIKEDILKEKARKKTNTPKQQFIDAIKDDEFTFVNALAGVAERAYRKLKNRNTSTPPIKQEEMAKAFMEEFQNKFTKQVENEEEGDFNLSEDLFLKKIK